VGDVQGSAEIDREDRSGLAAGVALLGHPHPEGAPSLLGRRLYRRPPALALSVASPRQELLGQLARGDRISLAPQALAGCLQLLLLHERLGPGAEHLTGLPLRWTQLAQVCF